MKITPEILEKYLDNTLSTNDKVKVEKCLDEDDSLNDALEGLKALREDDIDINELFQKSTINIQNPPKQKPVFKLNYKIAIAASIVILLGFTFIFQYNSKPHVSDFDFLDAGLPVHLDIEDSSNYNEFTNLYKLGDYKVAENKIDVLLEENSVNDTLLYYKAIILKAQKRYSDALHFYDGINSSSEYFEKANYQSAMCYWYLNNIPKLENTLTLISNQPNHLFHDRALLILKKL